MAGAQIEISQNRLEKGDKGLLALSLTEYDTDAECEIAEGSVVEIAGALFEFTADESITGWAGIGNSNDVYVKCVVAGTAVTAEFTTTAPTYSTSKAGWYGTGGAALHRYVAKLYKDGAGAYAAKYILCDADAHRTIGTTWVLTSGTAATFEAPWSGAYKVWATGGGGDGGGAGATGQSGGGGGGGGTAIKTYKLSGGQSCTYTIGAGGASSTFTDGIDGIAGTPGADGQSDSQMTRGGAGGGSIGGDDYNIQGQGGAAGFNNGADAFGVGGAGGGSHFGGGARGVMAGDNGVAANGKGGGGSGGCYSGSAKSGGAGAAGVIVIEYLGQGWTT